MKKTKISNILKTAVMSLLVASLLTTPIFASVQADETVMELLLRNIEQLTSEIQRLNNENASLQQQLNEANNRPPENPPQAPVHAPNIRLQSPQQITLAAGETRDITITVRNIGTHTASNLLTQAVPAGGSPFTIEFLNNSNTAGTITENRQHNMTMRISVQEDAQPGSHQIALTHFFRNQARDNRETSDTLLVNITGEAAGVSNLEIRNMQAPAPAVGVGETATITFSVYNSGDVEARNIRVVAAPENVTDIVPVQTSSTQTITSLAPGASHTLTFSFSPRESALSRSYAIGFTVTYGELSFQQFAAINVYNPDEEEDDALANLEIRGMSAPTGLISVGQTATITFNVHNTGHTDARNIRVTAAPEGSGELVPVQTSSTQTITSLAPGASATLSFSFSPREAASTRSYAVGFTVAYGELSFQQFAAINVYNPDEEDEATSRFQIPRVIVSETNLEPQVPRAGQEFSLEITFRNTSATRSVNNVRILMEEIMGNLPGQGQSFAGFNPLGGSNTLFIDYLPARGEITMNLRFTTAVEATPGAHNMRFSFDYQDEEFESHTATEQISISLAQVTGLELSHVNIGGWGAAMVGAPVSFSYNIINTGRVNLIGVRTRTEGPFDVEHAGRHIGAINAQRTTGFDGVFTPLEAGELHGVFVVYGEDLTGEIVELRHDFTIWVEGGFDDGFDGGFYDGGMMGPDFGMRPGGPGGGMAMGGSGFMCPTTGEWIETGEFDPETGEWIAFGEFCPDTGEWIPFSDGFDIIALLRHPAVWGSAIAVIVIAGIIVVVMIMSKKNRRMFDEDED